MDNDLNTELSELLEEKKNWDLKMAKLRGKMLEECIELIRKFEFTPEELGFGRAAVALKPRKPRKPAAPKFQSPYEEDVTWNGTGRAPRWYVKALDEGYTEELLRIEKPAE